MPHSWPAGVRRTRHESRYGGGRGVLRACDGVLSVERRNSRRDRREGRSARRLDRDAPDAARSRRDRGNRDEGLGSRRRHVPRSRAPDALLVPVVQPRSLHLPPATQAVAIEPGGVARAGRAARDGDRAGLARPSAARDRRTMGCPRAGASSHPVAPWSCPPGHVRRRSCVPERVARVRHAGAARATRAEGRGGASLRDAATHRRAGAAPADARGGHSAEYPLHGWMARRQRSSARRPAMRRPCLRDVAPAASQALSTIDMLPLVRITAFYQDEERPRGRGILFPRGGDIRALGVLFNTNIFPDRGGQYSESWIYGGAADRDVVDLSEHELGAVMDRDRQSALRARRQARRTVRPPLARSAAALRPAARVGARARLRPAEGRLPGGELRGGHRRVDAARAGRCRRDPGTRDDVIA